jgi:hypothetical protein
MIVELIETFRVSGKFTAQEYALLSPECEKWVEFKINPQRFLPSIFDGNWARPERHPLPGNIKLLRVIAGNDQIFRIIGRQGDKIFATPWIA